jgi:RNA polymerase sigma-70 factor (ECF subfamily)
MAADDSFDQMLARLRAGDDDAARQVFEQFAGRLVALAHSRLSSQLRQKVDAEDVLQSVFKSFFAGHAEGQYRLVSWDSVWGLLADITLRKCARKAEFYRAGRRDVQRELPGAAHDSGIGRGTREPTPSEAAILTETVEQLLAGLQAHERDMVVLELQGYTIQEIGERVGRAERSVYRILARVRKRLQRQRERDDEG